MVLYDEKEIARVFARIPCLGCSNWQADAVRAKVLAFLVAHWDGEQGVKPPSPEDLRKVCCRGPHGQGANSTGRFNSLSAAQRNRCPLMQDDTADDAVVQVRRDLLARRRPPLDLLEQALRHRLAQSGFLIPEHHVDGV